MRLTNKVVVIVGGGSGIGLAVAKLAQSEGASTFILGRSLSKLEQAKDSIGANVKAIANKLPLKIDSNPISGSNS